MTDSIVSSLILWKKLQSDHDQFLYNSFYFKGCPADEEAVLVYFRLCCNINIKRWFWNINNIFSAPKACSGPESIIGNYNHKSLIDKNK